MVAGMKRFRKAVIFGVGCVCSPIATQGQALVPTVPPDAVQLDGTLGTAEWSGAVAMGDGAVQLLVQQSEDHLLLGLRAAQLFVASVCLSQGQDVWVFHASSAVGRARYLARGEAWELYESFEWRLRDTPEGPVTQAVLAAHLSEFGWATNTVTTGSPGEAEFSISKSLLGPTSSRIAVGLLLAGDAPEVVGWPIHADEDGCTRRSTVAGPLEEGLTFDAARWEELEFGTVGRSRSPAS